MTASASPSPTTTTPKPPFRYRALVEWLAILAAAILAAVLLRVFVIESFSIPSGSMEPTLNVNDRLLVNKLSYDFHGVHRGDIVVFKKPADETAPGITHLVKRVIGLPGETISARAGHVYIDGKYLNEPWLPKVDQGVTVFPASIRGCLPSPPGSCRIPPGTYMMLGDNRTDSSDSRFLGPISGHLFVGRAFILVWPLSRIGFL